MEYAGIALVPLIIGLNQIAKMIGIKDKLIPIFSLLFGLALGIIFLSDGDIKSGVILGLYMGLSAVGLYSGVKNTSEEFKNID